MSGINAHDTDEFHAVTEKCLDQRFEIRALIGVAIQDYLFPEAHFVDV